MPHIRLALASFLLLAIACSKRPTGEVSDSGSVNVKPVLASHEKKGYDTAAEDRAETSQKGAMSAEDYMNRGYEYLEQKQYVKAIKDFTEAIRLDSNLADAYLNRGVAFEKEKEYDRAVKDYAEAIRLNPKDSDAYFNRGVAYEKKEDYDKAINDYTEVIRLNPQDTDAHSNRGNAYKMKLEYAKAIEDYTTAIRLGPNSNAHNALGWVLATCPKDSLRNGTKAITHATKACELWNWKNAHGLESLAAAHAEVGDFKQAVKWQKKATEFGFPNKDRQERAEQRLKQYESGKPCRDG